MHNRIQPLAGVCSISFAILLSTLALTSTGCSQTTTSIEPKHCSSPSQSSAAQHDRLYQYAVWCAFVNRIFDGQLTVRELQTHGDTGLGAFDFLDGELVMVDGVAYRADETGRITVGRPDDQIVFANVAHFQADQSATIDSPVSYKQLRARLDELLKSKNYYYAFKIHGRFQHFKCGTVRKQHKPFENGLETIIPNRPKFDASDVTGTLVGFYCPDFSGEIAIAGYHLHFMADDHQFGGHVLDFASAGPLSVEIDQLKAFEFELPQTAAYAESSLDAEFDYSIR